MVFLSLKLPLFSDFIGYIGSIISLESSLVSKTCAVYKISALQQVQHVSLIGCPEKCQLVEKTTSISVMSKSSKKCVVFI